MASCVDFGPRRKRIGSEDVAVVSAAPYPRRQQAYRLKRAATGAGAVTITAAGLAVALAGLTALAVVLY